MHTLLCCAKIAGLPIFSFCTAFPTRQLDSTLNPDYLLAGIQNTFAIYINYNRLNDDNCRNKQKQRIYYNHLNLRILTFSIYLVTSS